VGGQAGAGRPQGADGSLNSPGREGQARPGAVNLTNNPAYEGWWINELSIEPQFVEINKHGMLQQGEEIGGNSDSIYREMIRETIREHFRKETMLRRRASRCSACSSSTRSRTSSATAYDNNIDANGEFVQWFDELFREERAKSLSGRNSSRRIPVDSDAATSPCSRPSAARQTPSRTPPASPRPTTTPTT
jgi:type III restriction enzyme